MDLNFTAEENAFRMEVREFFRSAVPPDLRRKCVLGQRLTREELVRWTRILYEKGWATPAWAPEWGGTGWDPVTGWGTPDVAQLAATVRSLS